jgi:hypothetical protein
LNWTIETPAKTIIIPNSNAKQNTYTHIQLTKSINADSYFKVLLHLSYSSYPSFPAETNIYIALRFHNLKRLPINAERIRDLHQKSSTRRTKPQAVITFFFFFEERAHVKSWDWT